MDLRGLGETVGRCRGVRRFEDLEKKGGTFVGRLRKAASRRRLRIVSGGGEKETVLETPRKKGCRYASEPAEEGKY